jgi:hypothetical protein
VFNIFSASKNYSARSASAAKIVCRNVKYFETKLFLLIIFYNVTSLVIKTLIKYNMNICMCTFPHLIIVGVANGNFIIA